MELAPVDDQAPSRAGPGEPRRGTLDRALTLIDLLASDLPHATMSELAAGAGLSLSTTSRLLATLSAAGLVQRDAGRAYALGPRLVELGRRALEHRASLAVSELHPVRQDALALLRRELRDERDGLISAAGRLTGEDAEHRRVRELFRAASRESAWHECAVQIAAHPGAVVGEEDPHQTDGAPPDPVELPRWLGQIRDGTLRTLDTIDADGLSRIGTHRRYGPMSVLQCLQEIARGDHDQARELMGKPVTTRARPSVPTRPSVANERRVLLHHVNMSGVVTTVAMLVLLEETEAVLLRSLGLAGVEQRFVRIYFEIQHRRPCFYDEELTIHLAVSRVGSRSTHYDFTIFNHGMVAAFGRWGLGFRDGTGGLSRIPEDIRTRLEGSNRVP